MSFPAWKFSFAVDYLRERKAHDVLVRLAYAIGYAEPLEKTVIIDGKAVAQVGVMGPQRMDYRGIASALKVVMSELQEISKKKELTDG